MKRYTGRGTNNKGITKHLHYSHRLLSPTGTVITATVDMCVNQRVYLYREGAGDTFCIILFYLFFVEGNHSFNSLIQQII